MPGLLAQVRCSEGLEAGASARTLQVSPLLAERKSAELYPVWDSGSAVLELTRNLCVAKYFLVPVGRVSDVKNLFQALI